MIKYSINNNLANDKNYEYIEKKLDIDNYIDLWITEIFSGDSDMVNIRFFNHPDIDNNKVKTIAYDFDYSISALTALSKRASTSFEGFLSMSETTTAQTKPAMKPGRSS